MKKFIPYIAILTFGFISGALVFGVALNKKNRFTASSNISKYRSEFSVLMTDWLGSADLPEDIDRIRFAVDLELGVGRQDTLLLAIPWNYSGRKNPSYKNFYRDIIRFNMWSRRNDLFYAKKLVENMSLYNPDLYSDIDSDGFVIDQHGQEGIRLGVQLFCLMCGVSQEEVWENIEIEDQLSWGDVLRLQEIMKEIWHERWPKESWDSVRYVRDPF